MTDAVDRGLQPFVERAIEDLAERLGLADQAGVEVVSAALRSFPDESLGVDDGLRHRPAIVDGSEIVLRHDGRCYHYRTGGRITSPVLVEPGTRQRPRPPKQPGSSPGV